MIAQSDPSALEWFERATHDYVAGHQACPWCARQYCMVRRHRGNRVEFFCIHCEFSTCADPDQGQHYWYPGDVQGLPNS